MLGSNKSSNSRLKVLPDKVQLRSQQNIFNHPIMELNEDVTEPGHPRALRALSKIVNGGLCHRCGTCIGICPTGVLGLDENDYPQVVNSYSCTDCDLCVKVCPGDEFNFSENHQEIFNTAGDSSSTHGTFLNGLIGHASDTAVREHGTSGGLITGMLATLLNSGDIDGVLSVVSDEKDLWKGRPTIIRRAEDLHRSAKSKYAITPTNILLGEVLQNEGRYVLVGLPCQIHGLIKARNLDSRIKKRVVLSIALFCHAAIEHQAFRVIWDSLPRDKTDRAKAFVSRIGKHPGTPYLKLDDDSLYPVYFGKIRDGYRPTSIEMINILYRLYTPERCLTCFDALGEFADISVGDPWMAPPEDDVDFKKGWSFALTRTEVGASYLARAKELGGIDYRLVTDREALACNSLMSGEKRWRAFRMRATLQRQGKPIPEYMITNPKPTLSHFIKTEISFLTHIGCFLPRIRDPLMRFMLSKGGYYLLWLNSKRRSLRFWWRDTKSRVRRKLFGRR
jgi:coenzyme F420 hydrogenase subunit beta